MIIFAEDTGRAFTKAVSMNGDPFHFPSRVAPYFKSKGFNPLQDRYDSIVKYGDKKYFVGGVVQRVKRAGTGRYFDENKANENTLILTLASLFHAVVGDHIDHLITGVPLERYHKDKDALKELLIGTHDVYVATRNTPEEYIDEDKMPHRRFTIKNVTVTVEGAGAFFSHPLMGTVRVLDLGSRTVNCLTFIDRVYQPSQSHWFSWGWDVLDDDEKDFDMVAADLYGELTGIWPDKSGEVILVAGGVANGIAEALKKHYKRTIVMPHPNPLYANVLGYLEVGKRVAANGR